jgi:hypothetical protein
MKIKRGTNLSMKYTSGRGNFTKKFKYIGEKRTAAVGKRQFFNFKDLETGKKFIISDMEIKTRGKLKL